MSLYDNLIYMYDNHWQKTKISPIAHTKITSDIIILLDGNGFRMCIEENRITDIPCTIESETRTANIAPHLIHDKLSYVGILNKCESKHFAYLKQLRKYINKTNDLYAKCVYDYVSKGTIMDDISNVLSNLESKKKIDTLYVVFVVYPFEETINLHWTDYYINTLPINGTCIITGEDAHIPSAYPGKVRFPNDMSKWLTKNPKELERDRLSHITAGYIASQKIIHTLQLLCQGNEKEIGEAIKPFLMNNYFISNK